MEAVMAPTLAEMMAALPEPPEGSAPPYWDHWRRDLWWRAQHSPADTYYTWPCIRHTMLVEHFPVGHQLTYLQSDWLRWRDVVADPAHEANQRNLINQAYHLKLWEDTTGRRVENLGSILEFGGGYGAMALVAHRLGFRGHYRIHDLPEFAALQRWWLSTHGVAVEHIDANAPADLFVAIYSLSEIPVDARRAWIGQAGSYLLLYSSHFAEYNNVAWMRDVLGEFDREQVDFEWHTTPFQGRPDWYAIGWR